MTAILQVALDLLNRHRALQIASEAIEGGADWLEAGTPLIKSEGLDIVRSLKQQFTDTTIVADMKTMDTGAVETEIAAKAGADVICILGAAEDSTIQEAVKAARRFGAKIMVDLINVKNKIKRAQQLEKIGVDYLCTHVGIDQQMMGQSPVETVTLLAKKISLPIAVAGGLNSETVVPTIKAGASIIIVGGAITKAPDVNSATKTIKKAIIQQKSVPTTLYKKYSRNDLTKAFSMVSTPNISDAMHKKGVMQHIRPIRTGFHMVGQAFTVRTMNGDWAKPIQAIDQAQPGQVVVIDVSGGNIAVWGELATWSAKIKKLAGVVVDGAVRDFDDLIDMNVPIFSRSVTANAGDPKGLGEIGIEITCGEQLVQTGDWIIGDDSGVVVVPQKQAQEIANRALDVKEHENRIREEIKNGGSLNSVLKLKKWEKVIG